MPNMSTAVRGLQYHLAKLEGKRLPTEQDIVMYRFGPFKWLMMIDHWNSEENAYECKTLKGRRIPLVVFELANLHIMDPRDLVKLRVK